MDNKNILFDILDDNPNIWENKKLLKALLSDYLPEDKLRRTLLFISVEENIPQEIKQTCGITEIEIYRWSKRLTNACGCSIDLAKEIIGQWTDAIIKSRSYDSIVIIGEQIERYPKKIKRIAREKPEHWIIRLVLEGYIYNYECLQEMLNRPVQLREPEKAKTNIEKTSQLYEYIKNKLQTLRDRMIMMQEARYTICLDYAEMIANTNKAVIEWVQEFDNINFSEKFREILDELRTIGEKVLCDFDHFYHTCIWARDLYEEADSGKNINVSEIKVEFHSTINYDALLEKIQKMYETIQNPDKEYDDFAELINLFDR